VSHYSVFELLTAADNPAVNLTVVA